MLHTLGPILHLCGLAAPLLIPVLAQAFVSEAPFWKRSAIVISASLVSLPLGGVLIFLGNEATISATERGNTGFAIATVQLVTLWLASFVVIVGWLAIRAVARRLAK
jgi:hypothetical protein